MAIAIVDNHGFLVCYGRMDHKQTGSVQVALDKAKSAALYRRPTKAFEDGIAKGRVALLGLAGVTPIEGGVPIMVGARVVGGIGVSGANSDRAAAAAMAGSRRPSCRNTRRRQENGALLGAAQRERLFFESLTGCSGSPGACCRFQLPAILRISVG